MGKNTGSHVSYCAESYESAYNGSGQHMCAVKLPWTVSIGNPSAYAKAFNKSPIYSAYKAKKCNKLMEIHQVSLQWKRMLVSSVVVVAVIVTGLQAADCGGQCGYGTFCSPKSCFTGEDRCECKKGYDGRKSVTGSNATVYYCHQVCNRNRTGCSENTVCKAIHSQRYYCICTSGFARSSSGQCEGLQAENCSVQCGYGTFCSRNSSSDGGDRCECKEGYTSRTQVKDSNPQVYYCHQMCNNTRRGCLVKTVCESFPGEQYYCTCPSGFKRSSSGQCEDIDECLQNPYVCGKNSNCSNAEGNYSCECAAGYERRNGKDVGCQQDIDECLQDPDICGNNSVCSNTEGSYSCECMEGYSQENGENVCQGPENCSDRACISDDKSQNTTTDDIPQHARLPGYVRINDLQPFWISDPVRKVCSRSDGEGYSSEIQHGGKCKEPSPTTGMVMGVVAGLGALLVFACSFAALVIVRRRRFIKRYKKRMALKLRRQKKRDSDTGTSDSITSTEDGAISILARHEPTNAAPAQLPAVLSLNSHIRSSVTSLGGNSRLSYEIVDMPSQKEPNSGLFSLCKEGERLNDLKVLDKREYNELYANYKIKGEKAKQLSVFRANTDAITATNSPRATQMAAGSDLGNINGSFKNSEALSPADYDQLYANYKIKHMKAKQVTTTKASRIITPASSRPTSPGTNQMTDVNDLDSLDGTFENYKMIQPPAYDELYGNCRIAQNTSQAMAEYIKDSVPGDSEYDRLCLPSAIP